MAGDRRHFAVELEGFEKLIHELDSIGIRGERSTARALRAGGEVFLELVLANVQYSKRKSDKHLRDALKVSYVKLDDAGQKFVAVGSYLGGGKYRNGVYWGHIVEGGHYIVNKGKVRGYVSARPFMQPAYDQGKDRATTAIANVVFDAMGLKK